MALFYQHNINEFTKLAIWKIEEEESFFLSNVPLSRSVTHPHKRLQHLAGRYLLPFLFSDFPLSEILIADTRKPYLDNEAYHFSISHCGDFASVALSTLNRVGVDIELITPKVKRLERKFLQEAEIAFIREWSGSGPGELESLTMLWSAKEAIFKWYGKGQVDFREHMQLGGYRRVTKDQFYLYFLFSRESPQVLTVEGRFFGELVVSWVVS